MYAHCVIVLYTPGYSMAQRTDNSMASFPLPIYIY